jgi:hypothetical protein
LVTLSLSGQFPRPEDFPAGPAFTGKPVPPKLIRPYDKLFRTRIREGAARGSNFAGHYTIAEWGCGSSCVSIAVIDELTGTVYPGPFRTLGFPQWVHFPDVAEDYYNPLTYDIRSRVLSVKGCPEDRNCFSSYYEWTGSRFKLLRRLPQLPNKPR